ncbi:rhomboid family intramembrane serine protease [Fulvivirgaceae bacterium BMA10]|uniref:Rhomboid family intramembrane serine protease n=1 Tax=Splendidivirga corallicola TaxID=3051826 RepID=A0ABT8KTJ1_9BACT|nr:rhomboid family intramembrane serine protease [Fulvivirgaceae bacterium BMA10]
MSGILHELKMAFRKPDNSLYQLILINVIVFVVLGILSVISSFGQSAVFEFVHNQFSIPAKFNQFILRPWTIITYAFAHDLGGLLHILFNMLALYWFGRLIMDYLGSTKVINLYVLGALAGGAIFLLAYNLIPYYIERGGGVMVGASAAVFAIAVGAATLLPQHTFFLFFIGPVKIKYIVAIYVFMSFLGTVGLNAGGNLAHLGGALIGYIYIKQLQKGNDFGRFIGVSIAFIKSFFVRQPNIKVSYRSNKTKSTKKAKSTSASSHTTQDEIDAILDKINESGYESLTKEEKQKLFNVKK